MVRVAPAPPQRPPTRPAPKAPDFSHFIGRPPPPIPRPPPVETRIIPIREVEIRTERPSDVKWPPFHQQISTKKLAIYSFICFGFTIPMFSVPALILAYFGSSRHLRRLSLALSVLTLLSIWFEVMTAAFYFYDQVMSPTYDLVMDKTVRLGDEIIPAWLAQTWRQIGGNVTQSVDEVGIEFVKILNGSLIDSKK